MAGTLYSIIAKILWMIKLDEEETFSYPLTKLW